MAEKSDTTLLINAISPEIGFDLIWIHVVTVSDDKSGVAETQEIRSYVQEHLLIFNMLVFNCLVIYILFAKDAFNFENWRRKTLQWAVRVRRAVQLFGFI